MSALFGSLTGELSILNYFCGTICCSLFICASHSFAFQPVSQEDFFIKALMDECTGSGVPCTGSVPLRGIAPRDCDGVDVLELCNASGS